MGEEEKKPEEKIPETEEKKKEEKPEEAKPAEKPEEPKESKTEAAPPPPPPEIVLKVFMHCEGCARKVRRSLKRFPGVEDVVTDCKSHKVVVKGEKADPLKVLERVQRKSHRQVELLSPIPKPPEENKAQEEEKPKPKPEPEEKKEEPQIVTVLKVHMHCEACAQEIKRRIQRMKGVESAEPDLKNSEVSVKGAYDPAMLVQYVYKRTGKQAMIVKQEAEKKEKVEEAKEGKEEEGEKEKKGGEEEEKKEKKEEEEGGGGKGEGKVEEEAAPGEENNKVGEVKINEYFYNPPRYGMEVYACPASVVYPAAYYQQYPPQMFSDENPNACSVM
ncbi:heavy metal-associated isoprenylated plant protein 7 [Abrus precatorius]|uniref:Heavy metal-associated isoprenylated plant protein 7 n=1 Tax=Abrus precatorius TaxID=3816 RepID=A0A8B8JP34_ABRPR|nr:heavy metal-associated isoprenylated plant protein 7 [Abrus precatorius]